MNAFITILLSLTGLTVYQISNIDFSDDMTSKEVVYSGYAIERINKFIQTYINEGHSISAINIEELKTKNILYPNSTVTGIGNLSKGSLKSSNLLFQLIGNPTQSDSYKLLIDFRNESFLMDRPNFTEIEIGRYCEEEMGGIYNYYENTYVNSVTDFINISGTKSDGILTCAVGNMIPEGGNGAGEKDYTWDGEGKPPITVDIVDIENVDKDTNVIIEKETIIDGDMKKIVILSDENDQLIINGDMKKSIKSEKDFIGGSLTTNKSDNIIMITGDMEGYIKLGDGDNYIEIGKDMKKNIISGGGNNTININGHMEGNIITDSGMDYIYVEGNMEGQINTESGSDVLHIKKDVNERIYLGSDDDILVIDGKIKNYIFGGTGVDTIKLSNYSESEYNEGNTELKKFLNEFETIIFK